jgi:hypothetical protein
VAKSLLAALIKLNISGNTPYPPGHNGPKSACESALNTMGIAEGNYKNDVSRQRHELGRNQRCDRVYVHSSRYAREVSHGVTEVFETEAEIELVDPRYSDDLTRS